VASSASREESEEMYSVRIKSSVESSWRKAEKKSQVKIENLNAE
jgi:hypothetical protein